MNKWWWLVIVVVLMSVPARAQSPAADSPHAVYTSKVASFCNTSAEAFAAGDFTFIRKASGQMLEGAPRARYLLVLDADGKKVHEVGAQATAPSNFTGPVLETSDGLWVKQPVTFAGKTVNTVVVLFPPPPAAPPPPADTPAAAAPAAASTPMPAPTSPAGVPLGVVVAGLVIVVVVIAMLLARRAEASDAAAAPPPDPEEERRALRGKLGLDQVKDAFLGRPITRNAVFAVDKTKAAEARKALLPDEAALVDKLAEGQSLSAVTASVGPQEEMALHTALYRLMSAGIVEQKS